MRWLFVLALAGCTSAEIAVGPKIDPVIRGGSNWHGRGPVVDVALRREAEHTFCEYRHTSNLGSGWPFNDDEETTLDRVTCGVILRPR